MIKPGDEPIAGYRLEALLGRGQFGQVWRAKSPGNTTLALKFLELTGVHGWKEFRAIQRVKQIRHAHLMPIVAIWLLDDQGRVISDDVIESIAAEQQVASRHLAAAETLVIDPIKETRRPAQLVVATLLANQTLGDRLRECQAAGRKGIPIDELLRYMDEAAKGLDYLNQSEHKIGETLVAVQHCDVKPDNIMLAGGSVVISDFGVSQALAQARQAATGTSLGGTPAYMAPECFANKPCKATDQYSLAITYYELRTGNLPFREQTYAAVYKAHHEGDLDFAGCTPGEQRVLRRATQPDPAKRFASCKELVDSLAASLQPAAKSRPSSARSAWALAAAAVALVAGVVAGAVYYLRDGEQPPGPRPAIVEAAVIVEPADALVTIDGVSTATAKDGRIVIRKAAGSKVIVKASKPPERMDDAITIDSLQAGDQRRLVLPYSATHFAREADRLFDAGRLPEAAAALAEAIKLDPDQFAKMPEPAVFRAGAAAVECLVATPSGRTLASGLRDGAVLCWPLDAEAAAPQGRAVHRTGSEVKQLVASDQYTASLGRNGELITLTSGDGPPVELRVPAESGTLERIALAGDRWLAAAAESLAPLPPDPQLTVLYAWDLQAPDIGASRRELLRLEGEIEPRLAGAAHEEWVALSTTSTTDGDSYRLRICRLDGPSDPAPAFRQDGEIVALCISADDRWIAVGGGAVADDPDYPDYQATVINARTKQFQTFTRGHADSIAAMSFDPASRLLCTGSTGGEVHAWTLPDDWDASQPLVAEPRFLQYRGKLAAPAVESLMCPRGDAVACRHGGQVVVWDLQSREATPLVLADGDSSVTAAAATADGLWLITGHEDGTLRRWPLPRLIMVLRACGAAGKAPQPPPTPADQLTHCDRSARPVPCSPAGSGGTGRLPWSRPTAGRVG
ncbi:MAG: hypothetical protein DCC67_02955 [Planctomycetota bacterium]|nr:MAG: hypothetical protein DCC67_02955 [Planctomycetota bacterium]